MFTAAPVGVGVLYSLAAATGLAGPGERRFTATRLLAVSTEPAVRESLVWTIRTAGFATLLAGIVAVTVAVLFRGASSSARWSRFFAILPLPVPHLAAAATAVLLLGQSGLLSRLAVATGWLAAPRDMPALIYDRGGIGLILTLGWKEFPFLALAAITALATRGTVLEETARTLGAGPAQTFLRVTWPILWRAMAPSVVAVFVFAAGSYEAAALLAPSDPLAFPLLTLERSTDPDLARRGDAFVLALIGLGFAALMVLLHEWLRARSERMDG